MDTSIQKLSKMKKYIFCITAHTLIEKQSFGFLSWLSTCVFISNCGLNGYVYILEIVLDILGKLSHDFWNVCGCLTLNEMHIELASLIICSIDNNLTNTFTWSKRTVLYIVNLIILCTSTETLIGNLGTKYLTCLKHQINKTVVLMFCGSYFQY